MAAPCGGAAAGKRLVQYVVVRSDLIHSLSWPLGAVITQACHAATAAIQLHHSDPDTQEYLSDLDHMHKVVLQDPSPSFLIELYQENIPPAADETCLTHLSTTLSEHGIAHKLWVEQPENIPTCLALKPYPKETVQQFLKKFKLFK